MSTFIRKSHNVSVLLYPVVCGSKYRRAVFNADVDRVLQEVCLDIALRYEIAFLEIGTDRDQVHFLMQSVPTYSPKKIVQTVKSITAREIFRRVPAVKQQLWGGAFWSSSSFGAGRSGPGAATSLTPWGVTAARRPFAATSSSRAASKSTSVCTSNP